MADICLTKLVSKQTLNACALLKAELGPDETDNAWM